MDRKISRTWPAGLQLFAKETDHMVGRHHAHHPSIPLDSLTSHDHIESICVSSSSAENAINTSRLAKTTIASTSTINVAISIGVGTYSLIQFRLYTCPT